MMLDTSEAVFEALRENNERAFGRPRTVRAEELVEAAAQLEDKGALVTALFELMSAYTYSGETRKSPVVFARITRMWDNRPEDFSDWEEHQLYWRFKWVTTALLALPEVPLTAVERWTGEMRDRYRAAGHGVQPVYAMRYQIAAHTGIDTDSAYDLWVTRPRTDLSDCEACETRYRALHHLAAGDDAEALRTWEPVLNGRQTCMEEPYASMAHALLPMVRAGRLDEARSHHLTGYRFARGKADMADAVGRHLEFCALSRNEGRGLEVLAENRTLFEAADAPLDRLGFLTGVEILLARLAEQGHEELAVPGPPGSDWTVAALLARVRADASALAAAFDARNGSSAVGNRRLARLNVAPLLDEPLALGIRAQAVAGKQPAAAAAGEPAAAAAEIPDDFVELVLRARELTEDGRPDAQPLRQRVRALAGADAYDHDERVGSRTALRAELAEWEAFDCFDREEWPRARTALLEAAELYDKDGMPGRAAAARARAATALIAANERDPQVDCSAARDDLDAEVRLAEGLLAAAAGSMATDAGTGAAGRPGQDGGAPAEPGPGIETDRYLAVLQCATMATRHTLLGELPEPSAGALADFEASIRRLLHEAERLGSPSRASAALMHAGDVAARRGHFDAAAEELAAALELLETAGQPWRSPRPLALLAQIKVQSGHAPEAVPLIHQALSAAARWPDPSLAVGSFHALLGHACAHSGDLDGAVRHLSEAADRLDREGDDEHAAQVRLELADQLARSGRQADSVAVLESVVLGETEGFDPRLLAQVRLNLARGLSALDEHRAAAEEFVSLAEVVAGWSDEQFTHTLVACEAAVALAQAGSWDAARTAYARAVTAHAAAPRPASAVGMMREFARRVMAEHEAEGLETALAHLAEADQVCAEVPEGAEDFVLWYQNGANHYQRGRAYVTAASYPDALASMERAAEAYSAGGRAGEEPRAEAVRMAALIEANGLGEVGAATARLDAAIARCEAAGASDAAAALAALRSGLGEK